MTDTDFYALALDEFLEVNPHANPDDLTLHELSTILLRAQELKRAAKGHRDDQVSR